MPKERDFQVQFAKWLRNRWFESACFELKEARGKPLPIGAVKDHQLVALRQANTGLFFHKIPDAGFQNPWDCFTLYKVPAYVVIHYQGDEAVMIPVNEFETLKESGLKSINETTAKTVGVTVRLKD